MRPPSAAHTIKVMHSANSNSQSKFELQMEATARLQLLERALDRELGALEAAKTLLASATSEITAVEARIRALQQQYPIAVGKCL